MSADGQTRKRLEQEMRQALDDDGFRLVYQPQYQLADHRLVGCEALLRWNNPARGPIPPDRFIPIAEETGLILPLGRWVIREACRQIRRWQRAGLGSVRVAVNLSAAHFGRDDLIRSIDEAIAASDIRPELLELEITESVLMQSTDQVLGFMAAMRDRGIKMALDDFGTGYSSLAYLQRFAFDKLKIDRGFVRNLDQDRTSVAIVQGIVQLAHTLGMRVVAEGVETDRQLDALRSAGCDEVQGYLLASPLTSEDMADLLIVGSSPAQGAYDRHFTFRT